MSVRLDGVFLDVCRTVTARTLALLRSCLSWHGPCLFPLPAASPPPPSPPLVQDGTAAVRSEPPSTCLETRSSTCTSAPALVPERSSRPCSTSSLWWTIRPNTPCMSAASGTIKVSRATKTSYVDYFLHS